MLKKPNTRRNQNSPNRKPNSSNAVDDCGGLLRQRNGQWPDWLALIVASLAFVVSARNYVVARNSALASERAVLLDKQVDLGQETYSFVVETRRQNQFAMLDFINGNESTLYNLKVEQGKLVSKNYMIMNEDVANLVGRVFAKLQRASTACVVLISPARKAKPVYAELIKQYRATHGVDPSFEECQKQTDQGLELENEYVTRFRALLGLDELDLSALQNRRTNEGAAEQK